LRVTLRIYRKAPVSEQAAIVYGAARAMIRIPSRPRPLKPLGFEQSV
jgi:hypothetical protein